ncbi:MAG TPA: Crp/Fnr family transcriptional regulator, partial [Halomonas sp.]
LYSLCQGGADIFVVRKGWVSLYHSLGSRGHDICNVYMPGDIVGIRESFFDNHEITIVALENSVLDKVSLEDIHRIYNDCEAIKKAIISYVMVNDNITIERLRSCTHHKAEDRVAHFLLEIFARYNFKEMIGSNVFSFPITQEVVGELLGITSVHVSRCMTVLEQKKMIRKARSTIRLLQPEMMAELTGFDESLIYGCLRRS